jgi:hypothetical protein
MLVEDVDENGDRNISDKMSVYSRRMINNARIGMETSSINST